VPSVFRWKRSEALDNWGQAAHKLSTHHHLAPLAPVALVWQSFRGNVRCRPMELLRKGTPSGRQFTTILAAIAYIPVIAPLHARQCARKRKYEHMFLAQKVLGVGVPFTLLNVLPVHTAMWWLSLERKGPPSCQICSV
jgi:hypothetical protein